VIKGFADKRTAAVFAGIEVRQLARPLQQAARRKLMMLDAVSSLDALRMTPGNRLEALRGDRKGQYSIRINRQWRLCFRWDAGNATDVQIADYH